MTIHNTLRAALLGLAALGLGTAATADQLADIKAAGKIVTPPTCTMPPSTC